MDARRVGSGLNGLAWVSANGEDISESRGEAESVLQRAVLDCSWYSVILKSSHSCAPRRISYLR
jgi:hypothetical protein